MKPYYQDEWVTIYHGDCRQYLPAMGSDCYDLVFADYPFKLQQGLAEYTAKEAHRVLRGGGNMLVINNPTNIFKTSQYYQSFKLRNGIPLLRTRSFHPAWHLGFKHNYALMLYKEDSKLIWNGNRTNHIKGDVDILYEWKNGYRKNGLFHPEAITLESAEYFVKLLSEISVLDLFCGSGTVAVACQKLQRYYYGIEIEEKYCEIAAKRCSQQVFDFRL
tara:strand:- start:2606 stop:3259 length:654 start_codon:yes stop_codon:yes gene_type:complete